MTLLSQEERYSSNDNNKINSSYYISGTIQHFICSNSCNLYNITRRYRSCYPSFIDEKTEILNFTKITECVT